MPVELLSLLHAARIPPPYVLVAHSYGGIIAREFLACCPPQAASGMVLADAHMEKTYAQLRMPMDAAQAVMKHIDYMQITGMDKQNSFTAEDFARSALDGSNPDADTTSEAEQALMPDSAVTLERKAQLATRALGDAPLTVIRGDAPRDSLRIATCVSDRKLGTPEQREELTDFAQRIERLDKGLQMEQMDLSSNSRFVQAQNSGHHVQVTEPDLVAQEVLRVLDSAGY